MAKSKGKPEFLTDADNIEFCGLIAHLASLGGHQQQVATLLGVSPGHLSHVVKGNRHASVKHLGKLRKRIQEITKEVNANSLPGSTKIVSSVFSVDRATLRGLSVSSSVIAFRNLLWARAIERTIPTTRISISERVNVADGGVDASILSGPTIESDELLTTGTRFQIKTGDFAPWQKSQVDTELFGRGKKPVFKNLGSELQDMLKAGDRFVLVSFGEDPIDRNIRKARKNFADAFSACGYPDIEVEVWGQTHLIGLFRKYPSVCLGLNGHDHQGFIPHVSWASAFDMNPSVHYSAEQQQLIGHIRENLLSGEVPHVRLVGEPGVGKTRLALEVTSNELSAVTLYVKDGRALVQSSFLNELLQTDDTRFVVFVVDECSPRDLAEIWNALKSKSNRTRLVTIDHGPDETYDDKTEVISVEPTGTEQIVAILTDHGVGENDAKHWADYCEGCPRVAHVLGTNLELGATNLLTPPNTSEVWRRFVDGRDLPDSEEVTLRRIVLAYVSLFERFGFESPVENESQFIQQQARECDARITEPKFRAIVTELRERRIIQGTTTLYITPRLLHIHLYREFWRLYGSSFDIGKLLDAMPGDLRPWFVSMLKYAHDNAIAEKAIEKLLREGMTDSDGRYEDTQSNGKLIDALAVTCPRVTLRHLKQVIESLTVSELGHVTESRHWLVSALEKLAVWEDCFVDAAELLLDLAEAENSKNGNNASGTFTELFSLVPGWGPTQANPKTRFRVLISALESDSEARRALGLKACVASLNDDPSTRLVGPEHQGLRARIQFWIPATWEELWDAHEEVWNLLVCKLHKWEGEDRRILISAIIETSWSSLYVERLRQSVVQTLHKVANDGHADISALVELIARLTRSGGEKIPEDVKNELSQIRLMLDGNDFATKLRRFVKHVSWEDYHDDNHERSNLVEDKLDELALVVKDDPQILDNELQWLVREESGPAYAFAYRISNNDAELSILPRILKQHESDSSAATQFLSGYLAGIFRRDPLERDRILRDISLNPATQERFSDFVIGSGLNDMAAAMVIEQCESGRQPKSHLERWRFHSQLRSLSENVVNDLIELLILEETGSLWNTALQMFHTYYTEKEGSESVQARPLPEDLAFRLLTSKAMSDERVARDAGFYWSRLGKLFVDQFPSRKWELFKHVLNATATDSFVLLDLDTSREQLMLSLLHADPISAWACIAEVFDDHQEQGCFGIQRWIATGGHRIIGNESPGPIQHIPEEVIYAWVDEDPDRRRHWIIRTLPKTFDQTGAGRLTRGFVAKYVKNEDFRNSLHCHFHSRGWSGKASEHFRKLREQARTWLDGERDPVVIRWIEEYIDHLSSDIDREEIREERRY